MSGCNMTDIDNLFQSCEVSRKKCFSDSESDDDSDDDVSLTMEHED